MVDMTYEQEQIYVKKYEALHSNENIECKHAGYGLIDGKAVLVFDLISKDGTKKRIYKDFYVTLEEIIKEVETSNVAMIVAETEQQRNF